MTVTFSNQTLSEQINGIQSLLNQAIVSPLNAFGLGGFVFDIDGDSTTTMQADITDHYTEDNSPIQDHIAIRPLRVTLKNYQGELSSTSIGANNTFLQNVNQKLTTLTSYLPTLTQGASYVQQILNNNQSLTSIDSAQAVTNASNLWALVKNMNPNLTKQQQAYQYFKALHQQKILISVQTPHEFLSNMAIESIVAIQDETTKYLSTFILTLKQIRIVTVKTVSALFTTNQSNPQTVNNGINPQDFQNRELPQVQSTTIQGNTNGEAVATEEVTGLTETKESQFSTNFPQP